MSKLFGIRYWPIRNLGFFIDAYIPISNDGWTPEFEMTTGVQFSVSAGNFSFGAELENYLPIPEYSEFDMRLGIESRYAVGAVTPFIGLDFNFGLPKYADGNMGLYFGIIHNINNMFSTDASVGFHNLINDYDVLTIIKLGASLNF